MPTMMEELKELRGKKNAAAQAQREIFAEAGDDYDFTKVKVHGIDGDSAKGVAKLKELNDELDAIGKTLDPLEVQFADMEKSRKRAAELGEPLPHPGHPMPGAKQGRESVKSFGELFTQSAAYKGRSRGDSAELDIDLKTLLQTTAGIAPEITRTGRIVDIVTRPIQVVDIVPAATTMQAGVRYLEETTFTNNAAEIAEAGTYPEGVLAMTERTSNVQKVGVSLPVTDEQFEDVPYAESYVNQRLPFMVMQRLDGQILNGNGTAPNLRGVLNVSGIQTQPRGSDPGPDAIYKAMTLCRLNGRAIPGPVCFHSTDWQNIRLLKTSDGVYIWGSPSEAGPDRIWGQQVVLADALAVGTAVVGDWANYSQLATKRGMEVKMTDAHSTFFVEGKVMLRADLRCAVVFFRPAAFVAVTGL